MSEIDPYSQQRGRQNVPTLPTDTAGSLNAVMIGMKEYRKAKFSAIMVPVIMAIAAVVGLVVFWNSPQWGLPPKRTLIATMIPFVGIGGYFYKTAGLLKTRPYQKFQTELLVEKYKKHKKDS